MGRRPLLLWVAIAAVGCGVDDTRTSTIEDDVTTCGSAYVEGLDVSDGQGTIDWAKVAASGRGFAFIKATQGNYNKQKTFAANWTNAAAAGLTRSAYHFFDPTIDGSAQAQWYLDELGSAGGMTDADLPPMLDIECPVSASMATSKSEDSACEYAGDDGWVAPATMKQRIFDWVTAVTAATGRKPIIYSYPAWFADVGFTDAALADLPLYIATYGSKCASVPAPWGSATFWQYSATGSSAGISGKLDVDRFFGSAADLATWNAGTLPDAGVPDAPIDGAPRSGDLPDAGTAPMMPAGCGCGVAAPGGSSIALAALVAAITIRRRRRRSPR